MSDNGKDKQEQRPDIEIRAIWKANGQIGVQGNCIKDEMVALYLLEKAKDMVKSINKPKITPVKHGQMRQSLKRFLH